MSVINQMLKDLDQRSPEQGKESIATTATGKSSTLQTVLLTLFVVLCLNAFGFYVWNLQQQLANNTNMKESTSLLSEQTAVAPKPSIAPEVNELVLVTEKIQKTESVDSKTAQVSETQVVPERVENLQTSVVEVKENNSKTLVKATPITKVPSATLLKRTEKAAEIIEVVVEPPTKMSVSRRQLTSEELVEQKLAKAEKAINTNEITEAEQLFEEVLIIAPENKLARKKLAALWFGRKSYQQALNLLSQGIALDPQDGELRLLKARIHINQGQNEATYTTLKPLITFEHEEYQVMLANIAQQLEEYESATIAYQVLIKMQPYSGRWYLGIAIVYDKTSQFSLAHKAYESALIKADLSASSAKFAKQRMQALGE